MTSDERNKNGEVNHSRDDSAAYANKLQFDAAMMKDDCFGIKEAMQAEADLMEAIVKYKRLIQRGGTY